ncbi:MAG TPA: CGNR zinc finger domain-containing protein [Acidimicrobiia bacterium]|nr:CGNR zinc finger domain-containing protein [Acidimicrobiia bacterium]
MSQLSAAPSDLETLRGFVNTLNVEADTDRLATQHETHAWLAETAWQGHSGLSTDDMRDLRRLREAFRNQLLDNAGHHGDDKAGSVIAELGKSAPLLVSMGADGPELVPTGDGVWAVIGRLLAIYHTATLKGNWVRLKACLNDSCQWAYYDHSRNGSRRWCTSEGCGNLMAARAYRARDRQTRVESQE